jgi:hypothetical protein
MFRFVRVFDTLFHLSKPKERTCAFSDELEFLLVPLACESVALLVQQRSIDSGMKRHSLATLNAPHSDCASTCMRNAPKLPIVKSLPGAAALAEAREAFLVPADYAHMGTLGRNLKVIVY